MERSTIFRYAPAVLAAAVAISTIPSAAACPSPTRPGRATTMAMALALGSPDASSAFHDTIVGLWHVTYTSAGAVWDMSFDTYHSDGTENDNDMAPPSTSSVCEGVWRMTGPRTIKLHHVGWVWDSSGTVLPGTFTLDEVNTLSSNGNAYSGSFLFQVLDLNGNPAGPPTMGTIAATRITVP